MFWHIRRQEVQPYIEKLHTLILNSTIIKFNFHSFWINKIRIKYIPNNLIVYKYDLLLFCYYRQQMHKTKSNPLIQAVLRN